MKNILIVCTGNTCRSPMAERIVQNICKRKGKIYDYKFSSAGLSAFNGGPISQHALDALDEIGINAKGFSSTNASAIDFSVYDEIHTMTNAHKKAIVSTYPQLEEKIVVLGVSDPFGGNLDDYRRCRDELVRFYEGYIV